MNIDKVIEIYIAVDDFMNNYAHEMQQLRLKVAYLLKETVHQD